MHASRCRQADKLANTHARTHTHAGRASTGRASSKAMTRWTCWSIHARVRRMNKAHKHVALAIACPSSIDSRRKAVAGGKSPTRSAERAMMTASETHTMHRQYTCSTSHKTRQTEVRKPCMAGVSGVRVRMLSWAGQRTGLMLRLEHETFAFVSARYLLRSSGSHL